MTVAFYTLGCKVNSYETSSVWAILEHEGYKRVLSEEKADIYIINTCTVTNQGDAKSRKKIRQAIKLNPNAIIIVMGCYSQLNAEEVALIDGVDIVIGNNEKSLILDKIREYLETKKQIIDVKNIMRGAMFENLETSEFEHTRAYLKVQDGCNNFCSYCAIPFARGNLRSRPLTECIEEAKRITSAGYKEIVLTGIHTGAYGRDLGITFDDLLSEMVLVPGLDRLRISSMEISEITDKFLELLSTSNVLAPHLHLPLQSGSDGVLKRMNRKYDKEKYFETLTKIRKSHPNIAITTDLIVGFPGETEEEFKETMAFLKKCDFFMIHVFPYSKRTGTVAAKMPNQLNNDIKSQRVDEVMSLNKEQMIKYASLFIGKKLSFIPETYIDGKVIGHTGNYLIVEAEGTADLIGKKLDITLLEAKIPQNIGFF